MTSSEPTFGPLTTKRPSAGGTEFDDLDDLFSYDVGDENDPFSDSYKPPNKNDATKESTSKSSKGDAGLGIDEEVEVSKKIRAPRVKLDEHRLLSAAGIPKLRRKAKELKFKGKGHEYSDAARLLAFYQLWVDDLFPKARFLDALAMVEKTGHKRQMQTMRMEWINEGKPRAAVHEDSIFDKPSVSVREGGEQERTVAAIAPIFEKATVDRPKTPVPEGNAEVEMDDLYDATPKALRQTQGAADSQDSLFGGEINVSGPGSGISAKDGPPEDDLDALLAEEEMIQAETATTKAVSGTFQAPGSHDNLFEDDMEAIAEMDGFL